jgi:hypothetical protein
MFRSKILLFNIFLLVVFFLAGCATATGPAGVMSAYWKALIAKDEAQISGLSCVAYEEESLTTLESFSAVDIKLKDLACSVNSESGDTASVTCTGSIIATYGAEDLVIDLSQRSYIVKKEGGDWRVCGAE